MSLSPTPLESRRRERRPVPDLGTVRSGNSDHDPGPPGAYGGDSPWPVSSHRYPEVSAALLAATPGAHWLEYVDTVSPIVTGSLKVANGQAIVPPTSGLGLEWDETAVAKFLLS